MPVEVVEVLLGPMHVELVARRCLPRQPDRRLALHSVGKCRLRSVEVDGPLGWVARVLVPEQARNRALSPGLAEGRVEPQLVPHNPAAEHRIDVVHRDELGRRPQALGFEPLGVVAGLQGAVRAAEIELAAEDVRPLARDDVDDHAACLGVSEPARNGQYHFLRGGHLRHVPAAAVSAGPSHVDAVREDPRIGGAPAVDGGGPPLHRPSNVAGIGVRIPDDARAAGRRHAGNQVLDAVDVS